MKITERTLEVTIAGEPSEYVLSVQLFQPVDPALCKHATLTSKVEVVLKKATAVQWTALEARPLLLLPCCSVYGYTHTHTPYVRVVVAVGRGARALGPRLPRPHVRFSGCGAGLSGQ